MKIVLSDLDILNIFTDNIKSLYMNRDFQFLKYSDMVFGKLFDSQTERILEKLNIESFGLIFIDTKPFLKFCKNISKKKISTANKRELQKILLLKLILSGKRVYVCGLEEQDDFYSYKQPEQVFFEIEGDLSSFPKLLKAKEKINRSGKINDFSSNKQIQLINNYLLKYNITIIKNHVTAAKNDYSFINKFNEEMFYGNLIYKGNNISKETAVAMFEDERFVKIIDLSRQNERNAFIALYGITFKGLKINDIYAISGIFSLDSNREVDNLKRISSQEVFSLITNDNKDEIISVIEKMGNALEQIPLPITDIDDYKQIKQNYSLYVGLSDIGKVFSGIIINSVPKKPIRIAEMLCGYDNIIKLYDSVCTENDLKKLSDSRFYHSAEKFASSLAEKKYAYEFYDNTKSRTI